MLRGLSPSFFPPSAFELNNSINKKFYEMKNAKLKLSSEYQFEYGIHYEASSTTHCNQFSPKKKKKLNIFPIK